MWTWLVGSARMFFDWSSNSLGDGGDWLIKSLAEAGETLVKFGHTMKF